MDVSKVIEDVGFRLITLAVTKLPQDVQVKLKEAYAKEETEIGKTQLRTILENVKLFTWCNHSERDSPKKAISSG
jgi:tartrate dehydratase alpha subunit/fumarate hydratase class I-like protein